MKKLIQIQQPCEQTTCMHWKQCEKKGYASSYISNPLSSKKLAKKGSHTHVAVIPYFPDVSNEENLRNDFVKDICQLCSFLANRALPKHIKRGNLQTLIIPLSRRYGVTGNSVFFCKKNLDALLEEFPPDSMTFMGTVVSKTLLNKGFRYSFMEDGLEYHGYKLNVSPSPQQIMATDGVEIETAFEAFAKSMDNWWPRRHPQPELTYTQIKTSEELKDLVDKMIAFPLHKRVSMDYESMTLGGTDRTNKAVCVQFCWGYRKDQNFFIPLDHYESPIPHKVWKRELKRLFKNFLGTFVVFSAQFEYKLTKMIGENLRSVIDLHNVWFQFAENRIKCTGLDELGKMTLKALVYEWFGWKTIYDREDLWQRSEGLLYEKPLDELARYACADSIVTWAIMEHFVGYAKEIGYWETLKRTLRWCYNRTNRLLADMYETGFPVNLAWLEFLKWNKSDNPLIKEEKHIIEEVLPNDEAVIEANNILTESDEGMGRVSMLEGAGRTWVFSPNKPLHKRTLYCDVLKLEPVKFTKKPDPLGQFPNNPSFGKEHLDHYGVEFNKDGTPQENYVPTVGAIKKLTELSKMKSFVDSIWEYMNPSEELLAMPIEKVGKYTQGNTKARGVDILDMYKDYRIRSRIGNMFVLTGRLNAMQPNVQQFPKGKHEKEKKTIPKKNSVFLIKKWKTSKVEVWGSPSEKLVYLFKKGNLEQRDNPVTYKGKEYLV